MNTAIVYRPNGRRTIMFALISALAVHGAAVALCARHLSPPSDFGVLPSDPIEVSINAPETPPPVVEIPMPDPPVVPNVDTPFKDETPRPPLQTARVVPIARSTTPGAASFGAIKTAAISAPRPEYPYEARRRHEMGSGVAALTIDRGSGAVVEAQMAQSTGSTILDNSTVNTLRRWRFKPGTPASVRVPITFNLTGVSF